MSSDDDGHCSFVRIPVLKEETMTENNHSQMKMTILRVFAGRRCAIRIANVKLKTVSYVSQGLVVKLFTIVPLKVALTRI